MPRICEELLTCSIRQENYLSFLDKTSDFCSDSIQNMLDDYIQSVNTNKLKDPLEFWKFNESKWPYLAKLAKKYLGVQASSAAVERMFSISGHIYSVKRRRMSIKLFEYLVFLKLNEDLM